MSEQGRDESRRRFKREQRMSAGGFAALSAAGWAITFLVEPGPDGFAPAMAGVLFGVIAMGALLAGELRP